ncbi:reverse transcriptase domain, reverse transcriptase zinc-binding domain protein [Tanacetum coccineum]
MADGFGGGGSAIVDGGGGGLEWQWWLSYGDHYRCKEGRVEEKEKWVDNVWCWEWEWVRDLRGGRWALQESGDFTVRGLTKLVEEKILNMESGGEATTGNNWVPKKVNVFVWKALKGRLPVREELDKRGIDLNTKIGIVNAFSIGKFFCSNGNANVPSHSSKMWQAVIWTSEYFIWKERNARVFKGKASSLNKILQDIQLKSYEWIARRSGKKSGINWQQWLFDQGYSVCMFGFFEPILLVCLHTDLIYMASGTCCSLVWHSGRFAHVGFAILIILL